MKTRLITALAALTLVGLFAPLLAVEIPSWWIGKGVVDSSAPRQDLGVANLGQVKWFATQAEAEFKETLFGGSIAGWTPYIPASTDHNVANIAQLKQASHVFWDRLIDIDTDYTRELMREHPSMTGWTKDYPWSDATGVYTNSLKIATIGDLKMVFGFALRRDADGDGLVDYQELQIAESLGGANVGDPEAISPSDDDDSDGFDNITEAMAGTDATDDLSYPTMSSSFELFTPLE